MRTASSVAVLLVLGCGGTSLAASLPVDLSEAAINAATLADWRSRQEAVTPEERADDGANAPLPPEDDDTTPETAEASEGERASTAGAESAGSDGGTSKASSDAFLVRLQVLLDRAHVSPGAIDGLDGGNTEKAVRTYEEMHDLTVDGIVDDEFWAMLSADGAPVVQPYRLTKDDVDGRYVAEIPEDYGAMAKLDWLGYRGPAEMLAERFHMDEDLLRLLNPDADFKTVDATILVASPGPDPETKVARIVVSKSRGELVAYDEDDRIVLTSPATIGSDDTPSPSGTMKVNGSAPEPTYEYDPEKNFQQGENSEKLTIPAGPNGPVGSMWIDLAKPTYGIHGTPEPSRIDKTASHGCVRLTNWDAEALARLVKPAETTVEFED